MFVNSRILFNSDLYPIIMDLESEIINDELLAGDHFFLDENGMGLFKLNNYLGIKIREKLLFCWILLFHGVFKIEVYLIKKIEDLNLIPNYKEASDKNNYFEISNGRILLPSGKMALSSLSIISESANLNPLVEVTPGEYSYWLIRNLEAERKHEFLEKEEDHSGEVDWVLVLMQYPVPRDSPKT